jgi:hypothetical protein
MAKLTLSFGEKRHGPLAKGEIDELIAAAQGIKAIIKALTLYECYKKDEDPDGVPLGVLYVLEWLIEPIADYLFSREGDESAPDKEPETKET